MKYSISRYLNVCAAYFPSFTSDGRRIAFLSNTTGIPQVWQVALSAELNELLWPDQLTFATDRVMGVWFSPAPGDGSLIYTRDMAGNENAQLFLLSADGATEKPLTEGHENAMHIFGEWSTNGSQILFAANRRNPGLFDLYLQPLGSEARREARQKARLIWQNQDPGYLFNISFSPDGQRAVTTRMSSSFRHDLMEIDLTSGRARLISPSSEDARYAAVCYAPDGRALFINTDLGSDFLYISRLDLDSLAIETMAAPNGDAELMTCSPDGRYLAYTVNTDGVSELCTLDLTTGTTRSAPGLASSSGVVAMMDGHLTFSPDSNRLAFSSTSATRTSDVFIWDLAADQVRAVTRSSRGGLPLDSFISAKLIHYPTFDSNEHTGVGKIPAWFYKPTENHGKPVPALVVVHGGPESQFRPYFHFLIQYFLHNGYAVLAPNVRGSTGYGKAYSHLDDIEKRLDSVADLAYAAYWLKDQPDIDGNRLAVYGGSYGGFMVLSALVTYPDLWAAGVDIVGTSNFVTFLENTSEYRRAHREAEYGSLEHDREFLESIAPLNHVDKMATPLMVIHGANDPRVPLSEAEQLVAALKARGIPVEFLVFADEGHGLVKLKNKLVAYPAIVDFLNKHLSS